jgi:ABC-type polysaccharide/polyol phosphate export permease
VESGAVTSTVVDEIAAELVGEPRRPDVVPAETAEPDVQVVDYHPKLRESLLEAWHCRHLFKVIFWTTLVAYLRKYRLGPFWLILQTFMSVGGYALIFGGGVFNLKAPNGMPYFLYIMVGMMGWHLFQSVVTISTRSFLRLRTLVKDLHFPLLLVPIAGSAQALVRFFLYLAGYVMVIIYLWLSKGTLYVQLQPKYLFESVFGLFLCVLFAWGIGMWTAPLTAHTRDVRMVIKYILPYLIFVTPVLYPIDRLHGKTRMLAELNPLSSPVEMSKVGLLGVGSVRIYAAFWSIGLIMVVFLSGVWFMNRFGQTIVGLRPEFDDEDDEEVGIV